MRLAQMQNRVFFVLIIAVFVLFAVVFDMATNQDKMHRTIAKLVQEIALINQRIETRDEKKEGKE
jgi:hypothetical protein